MKKSERHHLPYLMLQKRLLRIQIDRLQEQIFHLMLENEVLVKENKALKKKLLL